ncbi:MAG: glycosyltransferase family 4 protein [Proteobacteria bacterium]|nr:glycosyltransferase family 4 protein [Pseudomonadota bacterium]
MRVGVYLCGLDPTYMGGLKTYAAGVVKGLVASTRGHQVAVFVSEEVGSEILKQLPDASRATVVPVRMPGGRLIDGLTRLPGLERLHVPVRNRRMRPISALLESQCDIVLFPLSFMATYRLRVPSIVSFHDLQHESYPEFFSWRVLRDRRVRFGATFRHATMLQASSNAMKQEALRVYGHCVAPERIGVIPEGVDYEAFSAEPGVDCHKEYGVPDEFLLYPAQLWHHKNHLRLLQALDRIRSREACSIPLVLTGGEFEAAPAVRRFIVERDLAKQVFLLGKVPYAALRALYRRATYVLSASLHESSCLPVLEAAASGSPLIVADIPPNRESARVFKLRLFDPVDVESIASTLSEAWGARYLNEQAVGSNREAARQYDWPVIADMYLEAAEKMMTTLIKQSSASARSCVKP